MATDIVDKIRKLLKLAEGSGNEHEAANAAARARALMAEYELSEAELRVADSTKEAEPIVEDHTLTETKRKVAWHGTLSWAVAQLYDCHAWFSGGRRKLFGRKSAVQAASYTFAYLVKEIDRLAEEHDPTGDRTYRNSFRLGAAMRVRDRIKTMVDERKRAEVAPPAPRPNPFDPSIVSVASPPAASAALVLVQRDKLEVDNSYKAFGERHFAKTATGKVKTHRQSYTIRSNEGFRAGVRAAGDININGGRGLRAPSAALKGAK